MRFPVSPSSYSQMERRRALLFSFANANTVPKTIVNRTIVRLTESRPRVPDTVNNFEANRLPVWHVNFTLFRPGRHASHDEFQSPNANLANRSVPTVISIKSTRSIEHRFHHLRLTVTCPPCFSPVETNTRVKT